MVPFAPAHIYEVRPGESLSEIAECSGLSVGELARLNRIADPDRVLAGTLLGLPSGHPCVPAPRPRVAVSPPQEAVSPPPKEDPARSARAEAERLFASANARNDAADFEGALKDADSCVLRVAPYCLDAKAKELAARCHVVAATAEAGMGRREWAIRELRHAFALDPRLELAPETTSPRLLELVSEARTNP